MTAAVGTESVTCTTCPHACRIGPGQVGRCRARGWKEGKVAPLSYGRITSIALDPVEKKPLARWRPGGWLVSVGSYGCNLSCPFCQNYHIAQAAADDVAWRTILPEELVGLTLDARARGQQRVEGIAHTYNEPLISWEYVRDTGILAHEAGLANVLVSNGCAQSSVIDELAPLIDAANIDLKGFASDYYRWCGGNIDAVKGCIRRLAAEPSCHLEVTTLIVPQRNDDPHEMEELAQWLSSVDPDITLHVTRYFPRWRLSPGTATPVAQVYAMAQVARGELANVVVGNC